jgi:glyoxylase-like metal-dependent hydrolase (beta-lactamase superfamily II)
MRDIMTVKIPFNKDFEVSYGVLETIGPGIRRITAHNPGPFTFRGTGTYILGYGDVAVIDPGPDQPEHVDAIIDTLGSERVSHILITHTHNDHSPGAKALKAKTGAPTYGFGPHGSGKAKKSDWSRSRGGYGFHSR